MSAESVLFWMAAIAYAVAAVLFTAGFVSGREPLARWGFWIAVAGFVAQTGSIIVRWAASGRLPYIQDYENALAGTWVILALFLLIAWLRPSLRPIGVVVMPFVILTLGYGIANSPAIGPVTPAYKSTWLVIHVVFAWFTYASYTAAASIALLQILKSRGTTFKPGSPLDRLPDPEALEDLTLRLVGFGFIVNASMIASGAVWAYELWGSYWRWDPVELWSLITWLAYALYLHLRLTLGWRGTKLAWIAFLALFGVMMSFWGVQFAPSSYHLFRSIGSQVPSAGGRF